MQRHLFVLFRLVMIALIILFAFSSIAGAQTETVIYTFQFGSDGANPYGALVSDSFGNLYGTTVMGGDTTDCSTGCGTAFRLSPPTQPGGAWTETVLYRFHGSDGSAPFAALVFDNAGNLYGTTQGGGNDNDGVVFELSPPSGGSDWIETVLYRFNGKDGEYPLAPLAFDPAGNLYGTTLFGSGSHTGVVFKLSPPEAQSDPWKQTVLHRFSRTEGMSESGVLIDRDGALFGTITSDSVFKLSPPAQGSTKWKYSRLHTFNGSGDGAEPCGLLADLSGALYGATALGGSKNSGVVYQLLPTRHRTWAENILYQFLGGADGHIPCATLVFDTSGNLYGSAFGAGLSNNGTVFKMSQQGGIWTETTLYEFKGGAQDGANPNSGVILGIDGHTLYGTTVGGGKSDSKCDAGSCGTVFQIAP